MCIWLDFQAHLMCIREMLGSQLLGQRSILGCEFKGYIITKKELLLYFYNITELCTKVTISYLLQLDHRREKKFRVLRQRLGNRCLVDPEPILRANPNLDGHRYGVQRQIVNRWLGQRHTEPGLEGHHSHFQLPYDLV